MFVYNPQVEISAYQSRENHYLVEILQFNNQLVITEGIYNVVNLIKTNANISITELCQEYFKVHNEKVEEQDIKPSIDLLLKNGVIFSPDVKPKKRKNKYLRIKFPIIPASVVTFISKALVFLYNKQIVALIIGSIPFVFYAAYSIAFGGPKLQAPTGSSFVLILLLFYGSVIFHELGHAAAILKSKQPPGEIGFGLYLYIMPVFYTNLSNAWRLNPRQRLLVDFGGIYFQYIAAVLTLGLAIVFPEFRVLPFAILMVALYQFNPFIRLDGYWIISDWLKQDKLMVSSRQKLEDYSVSLVNGKPIALNRDEALLVAFATISNTYVIVIYVFFLMSYPQWFFDLPKNISLLYNYSGQIFTSDLLTLLITVGMPISIIGLMFYLLVRFVLYLKKIYGLTTPSNA